MKKLALFVSFLFLLVTTAAFANQDKSTAQVNPSDTKKEEKDCKKKGKGFTWKENTQTKKWECVPVEKAN